LVLSATANASVDLPTPGAPANIETSLLLRSIFSALKALNTGGSGSPPASVLPTVLLIVLIEL
jgi:hypothetical protein